VITAFGERLAFREKDAGNVELWWLGRCHQLNSVESALEQWLHDPKVAECLNRTIPTDAVDIEGALGSILFQVTLVVEDGIVYPGGINANELSKTSTSPYRRPSISSRQPGFKDDCRFDNPGIQDRLGYELHAITVSPNHEEYTLNATARLGQTSRPLCVACGKDSIVACAVHLISGDRAVEVALGWDRGEETGPQPEWLVYDAAARKIAESIFIDRSPGDLQ